VFLIPSRFRAESQARPLPRALRQPVRRSRHGGGM